VEPEDLDLEMPEVSPEFAAKFRRTLEAAVSDYPYLETEWDTDGSLFAPAGCLPPEFPRGARVRGPDPDGPVLNLWPRGEEVAAIAIAPGWEGWQSGHFQLEDIAGLIYDFCMAHFKAR
jgi:hypothetical protein